MTAAVEDWSILSDPRLLSKGFSAVLLRSFRLPVLWQGIQHGSGQERKSTAWDFPRRRATAVSRRWLKSGDWVTDDQLSGDCLPLFVIPFAARSLCRR